MIPNIILAKGQHRVECGHAWVYRNEISEIRGNPQDGDIVDAVNQSGKFIARGYYNGQALISFRALARKPLEISENFWRNRLEQACARRKLRYPDLAACRLVHSEADFLPGLIVDKYADALVIQTNTLGMESRKQIFVRLLSEMLKPSAILEHNDSSSRELEKLPRLNGVLSGNCDGSMKVKIGCAMFSFNLFEQHKTGSYLDQQQNYRIVADFVAPGTRVLDGFCNMGGFAIHALLSGAREAVAVDSNAKTIACAKTSAELNGVGARLHCRTENMFDYLRAAQKAGERFDFIILDPPSFSRSHKAVAEARRGYKEIHLRAFKLLNPGGLLATFCCSHHVSQSMFMQFILEAARDARAVLRRETVMGAAPDHPVLPALPETEYLKGFVFSIC